MNQLTNAQKLAIRCAHADLLGSLQAKNQLDIFAHDWKAHKLTISELEEAFPDIISPADPTQLYSNSSTLPWR